MAGLFSFLFLVSLVALLVALIRPSAFGKLLNSSRKHLGFGFGFLVLLFLILGAITTPKTTTLQSTNAKATLVNTSNSQPKPKPTVTTKTVTTTQPVPYTSSTVQDSSLAKGATKVKVQGVNGVETQTFKVTYTNGQETSRALVSTAVTTQPVNEVIEDGTYVVPAPTTPAPTTTPSQSCYPLTNGGNCYKPGEYCRDSDHGASGVAGNGESISCEDNNGWRWEPK